MTLYELEDMRDKVTYHCTAIEQNLDMLTSLISRLKGETGRLEQLRSMVRDVFTDFNDNYEKEQSKIADAPNGESEEETE